MIGSTSTMGSNGAYASGNFASNKVIIDLQEKKESLHLLEGGVRMGTTQSCLEQKCRSPILFFTSSLLRDNVNGLILPPKPREG